MDSCKCSSFNSGTHEVQTCSFNSHFRPGTVNIDCNFTENSNAMGYLPVLSSITNSSLEIFVVAGRLDTTSSALNISVSGIPPDNYTVVVFDLARNGLPPALSGNINYAAVEEENITVTNPGEAESKGYFSGTSNAGMYNTCPHIPRISSIRRRGYYLFRCSFLCGYYLRAAFISLEILETSTTAG